MSDRKYELVYVVLRKCVIDNSSIPCAIFHAKDLDEAENTVEAYNQQFEDDGIEEYVFELTCTALYA